MPAFNKIIQYNRLNERNLRKIRLHFHCRQLSLLKGHLVYASYHICDTTIFSFMYTSGWGVVFEVLSPEVVSLPLFSTFVLRFIGYPKYTGPKAVNSQPLKLSCLLSNRANERQRKEPEMILCLNFVHTVSLSRLFAESVKYWSELCISYYVVRYYRILLLYIHCTHYLSSKLAKRRELILEISPSYRLVSN